MRRLLVVPALAAAIVAPTTVAAVASAAAAPNVVNVSVAPGSLHYQQKTFTAHSGLVRINFTNNSTAAHNVALEHNGEFEYGSTLTIKKGDTTSFLTLGKGTYHVYSSVGSDEDKGMSATLIVK